LLLHEEQEIVQPQLINAQHPHPVEEYKAQDPIIIVPANQNQMPEIIEEIKVENDEEAHENVAAG